MSAFQKKTPGLKDGESKTLFSTPEIRMETQPTIWVVVYSYLLAFVFCLLVHRFFIWCPPYLREIVKNLRGLPFSWFEMGLYWMERVLMGIAFLSALYHNLWKLATRYDVTDLDVRVTRWFPMRQVLSVPYGAVKRLGFKQSMLGVVLNYGHVEIDTGGALGPVVLANCPQPQKFTEALQQKVGETLRPSAIRHHA